MAAKHPLTCSGGAFRMRYRVAAIQFEPRFADKPWNVQRLLELAAQAAREGARLVVLPEMATTGYCFRNRAEITPLVEPVPGPTVEAFCRLAAEHGVYVVVSLPEVEPATGAFYNTAALVGPEGYIGKYRKTHSYVNETLWARDGDLGVPVFETALGRIGMMICMDADYIEPARVAALSGADLIAFPNNWIGSPSPWYARALDNGVYVISANRWGEERGVRFRGHSAVIDPRGVAVAERPTGDGIVAAEVDLDLARAARTLALAPRRPDHYQELLLNSYLWHHEEVRRLPAGRPTVVAVGQALTLDRMADQARWADRQARDKGWPKVDLVVFPMCDPAEEGAMTAVLQDTARALDCHIVWGITDDGGYATVWLTGPGGLVGRYRQMHPDDGTRPGDLGFLTFDMPWGRLGLLGGGDLRVPEAARILAKRGADLIAVPAGWGGLQDRLLWQARAMENDTAVAVANSLGGSRVFHAGQPHPDAGEGEGAVALCLVDTGRPATRCKELLRKLQPQWYDPLVRT